MADLAWYKAAGVLALSADKRAAGWPETFTAEHLARLQYPSNGSARDRRDFVAAIKAAIEAGAIRPEYKDETISLRAGVERYVRPAGGVFAKPEWEKEFSAAPRHSTARVVTNQYDVRRTLIPRAEFARWWGNQREAASEHIEAWLACGSNGQANETAEQRNRRVAAAYVDGSMPKADALGLVGSNDNLKRIRKDEILRRKAVAVLDGTMSKQEALSGKLKEETLDRAIAAEKKRRGIGGGEPTQSKTAAASKLGVVGWLEGGAAARPTRKAAKG